MKNCYVSGLHDGARVDDVFLICNKSLRQARNGSMYIRLELRDRTGSIDAFKWDASESVYTELPNDDFVQVRGTVGRHDGKLQISVDSFRRCSGKVDPGDFLPRAEQDIDVMLAELTRVVESISHPQLRSLLDHFFKNDDILSRFSTAPAAQKIHHAYIGGLLEHSLAVARMCDSLVSHYRGVDRDLLMTGAILHDIGKIEEFCWDRSIRYSTSGHLVGHVVTGAMMIENAMEKIDGFHPLLRLMLAHMILSHHGEKEFGSPKRPKSIEAIILHHMDDMDAKINTFQQAVGKVEAENEADLWTEKHWVFERPLFRGMPRSIMGGLSDRIAPSAVEPEYDPFAETDLP